MTAPDSLTIFGTPFIDDGGGAIAYLPDNAYAFVSQLNAAAPWVCNIYRHGNVVVWEDTFEPGPELLRAAERAYVEHVRADAAVAGLEIEE